MSLKDVLIIRAILSPMCFICCASDLAIGIKRLTEHNYQTGIAFLFMGIVLFILGYGHSKKVLEYWKSNKHNKKN